MGPGLVGAIGLDVVGDVMKVISSCLGRVGGVRCFEDMLAVGKATGEDNSGAEYGLDAIRRPVGIAVTGLL